MKKTLQFQSRRTFARADLETVVQIPLCGSGADGCDRDGDDDCDDDCDDDDDDNDGDDGDGDGDGDNDDDRRKRSRQGPTRTSSPPPRSSTHLKRLISSRERDHHHKYFCLSLICVKSHG